MKPRPAWPTEEGDDFAPDELAAAATHWGEGFLSGVVGGAGMALAACSWLARQELGRLAANLQRLLDAGTRIGGVAGAVLTAVAQVTLSQQELQAADKLWRIQDLATALAVFGTIVAAVALLTARRSTGMFLGGFIVSTVVCGFLGMLYLESQGLTI